MEFDNDRIDEAILGLLYLTLHDDCRAWKGMDWDSLSRLHDKGLIEDPVNKAKSIVFTSAGLEAAERVSTSLFGIYSQSPRIVIYGGAEAKETPAAGVRGVLCRSAVSDEYFFRVYEKDGSFTDYDLRHNDLNIIIEADALASFYQMGSDVVLDHSPEVLGLRVEGNHGVPTPELKSARRR